MDSNRSSFVSTSSSNDLYPAQPVYKPIYGTTNALDNAGEEDGKKGNAASARTQSVGSSDFSQQKGGPFEPWAVYDPEESAIPTDQTQVYLALSQKQDSHTAMLLFVLGFLVPLSWFLCWKKFAESPSQEAQSFAQKSKKTGIIMSVVISTLVSLVVIGVVLVAVLVPVLD